MYPPCSHSLGPYRVPEQVRLCVQASGEAVYVADSGHLSLQTSEKAVYVADKVRLCVQASGEAVYVADVGVSTRELFAAPVESARALAKLGKVDPSAALKLAGVVGFVGTPNFSPMLNCF